MNVSQRRRLSIKMRKLSEDRKCPSCLRKNALIPCPVSSILVLCKCIHCGYEETKLR